MTSRKLDPVLVDRGALNMVLNMLRRDAEEGKQARGEAVQELEKTIEELAKKEAQMEPIYQRSHNGMGMWSDIDHKAYMDHFIDSFDYRRVFADPEAVPRYFKNVKFVIELIERLVKYRAQMSYNDSYFGEPAGELKSVFHELEHQLTDFNKKQQPADCYFCDSCLSQREVSPCWKCDSETRKVKREHVEQKTPDIDTIIKTAKECGYLAVVHGSQERDLDVVCVPWTDSPSGYKVLWDKLCEALTTPNGPARVVESQAKPWGRRAASIQVNGFYKLLDISVASMNPSNLGEIQELCEDITEADTFGLKEGALGITIHIPVINKLREALRLPKRDDI